MAHQLKVTSVDAPSFGQMLLYEYYDWMVFLHGLASDTNRAIQQAQNRQNMPF